MSFAAGPQPVRAEPAELGAASSPLPRLAGAIPRWWPAACWAAVLALLAAVVAMWAANGNLGHLGSVAGGLTSTGRLSGLLAAALMLVQVLLMARIPVVERSVGQDELARRHRVVGVTSFSLMVSHIALIWLGYTASTDRGPWGTAVDLVLEYPGILLALAATVALCLVVVTSVRRARARLRYESWHLLHLYAYLGVGLALPHQLWNGSEFVGNLPATLLWWGLWGAALMAVLTFRVGVPLYRTVWHQLHVLEVRAEAPGVTTVVMAGRHLDQLPAAAGQFFQWRFVGQRGRSRAHPYSLSAAPDGRTLRITAAHLGDGSAGLAHVPVGSRVMIEGPYGRLHAGVRSRRKVLLVASGIGITPMRALLEDLPQEPGDVTLLYRARNGESLIFPNELAALGADRGARVLTLLGPRATGRPSWLPQSAARLSDSEALRYLVPDVADHDVYVCGAEPWMQLVTAAALACGVPPSAIHVERFAY